MAKILVLGADGFIGGHLVKRLKREGHWVRGVDLMLPRYSATEADDFVIGDLREADPCRLVVDTRVGEAYQLAADMGGAGYIVTGANDAEIMFIDECLEGTLRLMRSSFSGPVNIGSEEMISINALAELMARIAGKRVGLRHVRGPQGVRGRRSDNALIRETLGWAPRQPLAAGLEPTYRWIAGQVAGGSQGRA